MIDIYTSSVRITGEKLKTFGTSSLGIITYGLLTGIIGIVILLTFFSMVLSPATLLSILPCIIAFNAAVGGYNLAEKQGVDTPHLKLQLFMFAAVLTITGCSLIIIFCPWEPPIEIKRYLISGLSALFFTFLGAWISYKNNKLNSSI